MSKIVKNTMSRKKFLSAAVAGLTGVKLMPLVGNLNLKIVTQRRSVGKTGILVSPVCFGASRANEESLVKYVIDKGINFIDTGRSYANGNNEKIIGRALSGIRNNVVIQSKIRLDPNELPSEGKGRKGAEEIRSILNSKVEASLKALDSDYIDILLYHDASEEDLLFHPEVMKFFDGMKAQE